MNRMGSGMMGGGMMQGQGKTDFSSNGERIFYRGVNSKGEIIKNTHGMEGIGCAMCHGADAKGSKMMMDVPDIRWSTLINPEGHIHTSGRRHPAYTEESFKTCVIAGIDPAGNQFSTMMPRWEMSKEDIDDLINYLKTK
jgi:cytochrome c oxidase subunit 2